MRGIEFIADVGYSDVLNTLLEGISLHDYDFYISEEEVFSKQKLPEISKKVDQKLLDSFRACGSYYMFFLNLQAYPPNVQKQSIITYDDFENSNCQFIILIVDGQYFEIYVKDDQLLLKFIKNAIKLHGQKITIKSDYEDGRTRMSMQ